MQSAEIKPFDIATGEIEGWRGRCLNIFARGEHAVAAALEVARAQDPKVRIPHLAGQRLTELERVASMTSATEKQKASLTKALTGWKDYDQDRPWLSHGIVTVLLDRNGEWHAQFDMTKWQANLAQKGRKTWSKAEALEFEKCLASAFRVLSSQLGQFRKRLN